MCWFFFCLDQTKYFLNNFRSYNNQRNQQFDPYGNPIKDPLGIEFNSNSNGNNNPLAHLNDSVNSLDPLNAMEKSLNDQVKIFHPTILTISELI